MINSTIANPWIGLPTRAPFVLGGDEILLNGFNERAKKEHHYNLTLYPDPFFGATNARVVVLLLNPGLDAKDLEVHARSNFAEMAVNNLAHKLEQCPFMYLHPNAASTPGGAWWKKRLRQLIDEHDVGLDAVANGLACVQFMPYHSIKYSDASPKLPSQQYGFQLVRNAIARGAEIVIMRSLKLWFGAVPELESYARLHIGLRYQL